MLRFSSSLEFFAGERGLGDRWAALETAGEATTGVCDVEAPPLREVRVAMIQLK